MAGLYLICLMLLAPAILATTITEEMCVAKVSLDKYPRTCKDVKDDSSEMFKLVIMDDGMEMMCDTKTDNGGWTVIQRRTVGDLDFYREWDEYKYGFANDNGDFWYGLDRIHYLTAKSSYELYITFDYKGSSYYARYAQFRVMSEKENYKLQVSGYSGNAGDSLIYHNNAAFSTKDRDNDQDSSRHCAQAFTGAWWYVACHRSNLNGDWGNTGFGKGLNWKETTGHTASAINVVMRIRQL